MKEEKEKIIIRECDLNEKSKKTEEEEESFDTKLIASFGNIMYYLKTVLDDSEFKAGREKIVTSEIEIVRCTISDIIYDSKDRVYLHATTEDGELVQGIQELFFKTVEEAKCVIERLRILYLKGNPTYREVDDYMECVKPKYRYIMKFPMKPGDIILEEDTHYMAEGIHAELSRDYFDVQCYGKNNLQYKAGKRVFTIEDAFFSQLCTIEKL